MVVKTLGQMGFPSEGEFAPTRGARGTDSRVAAGPSRGCGWEELRNEGLGCLPSVSPEATRVFGPSSCRGYLPTISASAAARPSCVFNAMREKGDFHGRHSFSIRI